MKNAEELTALVTRAKAGELETFNALVRRFQDMAVGNAYSILNDRGLAQDAAQEAFIQLYYDLRQILDPTRLAEPFRITVSGGVVWYPEEDTAESLLERADQCLGLAKHNGQNQIRQEA
jgi:GGDEF domain-containing protein